MKMQLENKVAVVTGASKGIGLAVVEALVAEGVRVVAGSRSTSPALAAIEGVVIFNVDLSSADGANRLVQHAIDAFGQVDVLVNNVGGLSAHLGGFLSITDEEWAETMNLNLMSAVRASRAALPSLIEHRGHIINISSINGRLPQAPISDYSAAKAALTNLTKGLSQEFGPVGVRVNSISPGPVRTPLWEDEGGFGHTLAGAMAGGDHAGFLEAFPAEAGMILGRFTEPEEIAAMVVLLASEQAGSVTGSDWIIDGGMLKNY